MSASVEANTLTFPDEVMFVSLDVILQSPSALISQLPTTPI